MEPISKLFTMSMQTGELPKDWRRANITPLFKKGDKNIPSNYRPVCLISIVVKTLERLIHNRISEFLNTNNKLVSFQHGFRRGHSCQTQLLSTVHDWVKSIDSKASSHVVFLDFCKAVPHRRLLLKLEHIGIRGTLLHWIEAFLSDHEQRVLEHIGIRGILLHWIEAFLSDREQRVLIDGHSSDWAQVISGVPQGSILGPLLLLVYVNDIGTSLTSTVKLFADDCTLYREIRNKDDAELLQYDLNKLYLWTRQWLNASKCKVMRITNKKIFISFDYKLNDLSLEWVNTFKFLGIKITQKVDTHIGSFATRLLNLLRRNMSGCSKQAKSRPYTALVQPQLETSVPVWSPCDSIEKVQKRAARWICAKWDKDSFQWSHSYDDCRLELGWQTLKQRRKLLIC